MLDINKLEIDVSALSGHADIKLELKVDGVNKTFYATFNDQDGYLRMSPLGLHPKTDIDFEYATMLSAEYQAPSALVKPLAKPIQATIGGQRYCGLLSSTARGEPFSDTLEDISSFAVSLAKLHVAEIPTLNFLPEFPKRRREGIRKGHSAGRLGVGIKSIESGLAVKPLEENDPVICHGDAWPGNALFSDTAVLFDFEHTFVGPREFDLGTVAWWLLGRQDKMHSMNLWETFMNRYLEETKIKVNFGLLPTCILQNEIRSLRFLDQFAVLPTEVYPSVVKRAIDLAQDWRPNGPSAVHIKNTGKLA